MLPLWETWAELVYPNAQQMMQNLVKTREYWTKQLSSSLDKSFDEDEGAFDGDNDSNDDSDSNFSPNFLNTSASEKR